MPEDKNTETLESVRRLVNERAVQYRCGFRTAFVQWTSQEEKQGVEYPELHEHVTRVAKFR